MSGTYPQKRSFDSWIVTKLKRVRFAFVDRNDSRVRHVTGAFALFRILLNNSDVCRALNIHTLNFLVITRYVFIITRYIRDAQIILKVPISQINYQ